MLVSPVIFIVFVYILVTLDEKPNLCKLNYITSTLCMFPRLENPSFEYARHKVSSYDVNVIDGNQISTIKSNVEWLEIPEGRDYSDYGDNTCGDNPDRHVLKTLFKHWIEIAETNNISYFLFGGTLLGSWRNSDVIPYDSDLDILVDRADNMKLEATKNKRNFSENDNEIHLVLQEDWRLSYTKRSRISCTGEVVPRMVDECSFQDPLGRVIMANRHLDIYEYEWRNGTIYESADFEKVYLPKDVFPLKYCKFMGLQTFCPKYPKAILNIWYGKNLRPSKQCKNKKWTSVK